MNEPTGNSWAAFESHTARMVDRAREGDWPAVAELQLRRDALLDSLDGTPDGETVRRLRALDGELVDMVRAARDAAGSELAGARKGQRAVNAYGDHQPR